MCNNIQNIAGLSAFPEPPEEKTYTLRNAVIGIGVFALSAWLTAMLVVFIAR